MPVLSRGRHRNPRRGACFMELASYLAGERWSDHPSCTHPLLAALARLVNDNTGDARRGELVTLVPSIIGLTGDDLRIDAGIALRCATTALPIAAAERQLALAVSVLAAEEMLSRLDGRTGAQPDERSGERRDDRFARWYGGRSGVRPGERSGGQHGERFGGQHGERSGVRPGERSGARPGERLSEASRLAMEQVPLAAEYARRFSRAARITDKGFRKYAAPNAVQLSVVGIAQACITDPDAVLRQLLTDAIADVTALVDRPAPERTASPRPTAPDTVTA